MKSMHAISLRDQLYPATWSVNEYAQLPHIRGEGINWEAQVTQSPLPIHP